MSFLSGFRKKKEKPKPWHTVSPPSKETQAKFDWYREKYPERHKEMIAAASGEHANYETYTKHENHMLDEWRKKK